MIDPFDAALSEFIDTLPADAELARQLLEENAPFTGRGDLPEFAELATRLRAVPPPQPRPEWVAASKARLMAAPLLPPEKRGFTWLGSMFLPFTQLSFPSLSLPRLTMPSPVFARAAMALMLIVALASVAQGRAGQNPIVPATDQAPAQDAQQAIAATQNQVARLGDGQQSQVAGVEVQGTARDVVLLSQQIDLAELAIDNAPPAQQPQLRAQLQSAVRAVRFDGQLEAITNDGSTLQVSGVAVQADPSLASKLEVGQPVSLLVRVNGSGKLQAVQASPAATPTPVPAATQPPSSPPAPPPPAAGGGTAPQTSSSNTTADAGASPASAVPSPAPAAALRLNRPASVKKEDKHEDGPHGDGNGQQANAPASMAPAAGQPSGNGGSGASSANGQQAGNGAPGPQAGNGSAGSDAAAQAAAAAGQTGQAVSQVAGATIQGGSQANQGGQAAAGAAASGASHANGSNGSNGGNAANGQHGNGGSSDHGGGDHAQASHGLAAVQISLPSSDNKGKGKADHKG